MKERNESSRSKNGTKAAGLLDAKLFSAEEDAINYAKHEGPESVEGNVVKANIYSADGKLVWSKANLKD